MPRRFDVYDGDGFAPARVFLLKRAAATSAAPLPGEPGRWALPEDPQPLLALAAMYKDFDWLYNTCERSAGTEAHFKTRANRLLLRR
jgi:hypothetical protein